MIRWAGPRTVAPACPAPMSATRAACLARSAAGSSSAQLLAGLVDTQYLLETVAPHPEDRVA